MPALEIKTDITLLGNIHTNKSILNTFLGHQAGKVATGAKNTFIGHEAGLANTTGEGNVFIGNKAGSTATATDSNKLIIANSATNKLIEGDFSAATLSIGGRLTTLTRTKQITEIVANVTAGSHHVIVADATAGDVTVLLPAVATSAGKEYVVKRAAADASANVLTIDGAGAETIDNAATKLLLAGEFVTLICDGTEWHII